MSAAPISESHEHLLRPLAPEVLGLLVRRYGSFDACEDAVQEALLAALRQWPQERRSREPARVAAHRRLAQADRRVPQRRCPAPARAAERVADNPSGRTDTRRLDRSAVPLLSRGALAGVADRADAARGRRPDDRRDRERVPRPRGDDGAADQPREADDRRRGRELRAAGHGSRRTPARRGAAHPLSDLQRGLHRELRRADPAARARPRGDPADADAAPAAARRRRGHRPAGADAADPRPPSRAQRTLRRADPARRAGPQPLGSPADRRGRGADRRRAEGGPGRPLPAPGGDRGRPRRGANARPTPTGGRSRRCTSCSSGSPRTLSSR